MYMEKKTGFIILLLTWLMVACSRLEHSHGVPVDVEYVIDRYEMVTTWYDGIADNKDYVVRSEASGVIDTIAGNGDIIQSNAVVATIKTQGQDDSTYHLHSQIHCLPESKVVNLHIQDGDIVQFGDALFSMVPTDHIHVTVICSETE